MKPPVKASSAWSQGFLRHAGLEATLPHELAAKTIIPSLRGILAHIFRKRGMSQHRIALLLSVSQPMVSKYLRKPLEYYESLLAGAGIDLSDARRLVNVLANLLVETENPAKRILIMASIVNSFLNQTSLCRRYSKLYERDICRTVFPSPIDPYIEEARQALTSILEIDGFYRLVPEVGSNLVYAPTRELRVDSIIGVQGRIVKTLRGVIVAGELTYGGSRHTARLLAKVAEKDLSKKAAIVLKYSPEILRLLRRKGLAIIEVHRQEKLGDPDAVLLEVIEKTSPPIDVLVDRGGFGIEPVIYLFASSLQEIVEIVELLAGNRGSMNR